MGMLMNLIVGILSQLTPISNHHVVYFIILFVSVTLIKLKGKKKNSEVRQDIHPAAWIKERCLSIRQSGSPRLPAAVTRTLTVPSDSALAVLLAHQGVCLPALLQRGLPYHTFQCFIMQISNIQKCWKKFNWWILFSKHFIFNADISIPLNASSCLSLTKV